LNYFATGAQPRDGGTLEFVFETGEQELPQTVAKEKVAEIVANFMTVFYHILFAFALAIN